ncbi:MAG: GNAT family N-acetyltransferase [Acidobacteriota bacterium]
MRVEVLERRHRTLLKEFRNQHPPLVEYLRRYALRHAEKDQLSRTYLALPPENDRIAGYFSLAAASVERLALGALETFEGLPRFPVPGVLLARLAVDERAQGQGVGRFMLEEALGISLHVAAKIAARLLVADAIDNEAARFYERFGFARLSTAYPCRMVLDLKPLLEPASRQAR